jgi:transcriptional regulator of acetoin/glycerol metabolism
MKHAIPPATDLERIQLLLTRAFALIDQGKLKEADLQALVACAEEGGASIDPTLPAHEVERIQLLHTLQKNEWNIALVARKLGLGRPTVYNRMKRYGIDRKKVPKTFKKTDLHAVA